MALKTYNPTTPSQRQLVIVDRSGLYKGAPVKALTEGQHSTGGRNNNGRITSRFRGGGHKQAYRRIDFRRSKFDVPATVERHRIRSEPHRLHRADQVPGRRAAYILAPQRLAVGDTVISAEKADVKPGNAMPIGATFRSAPSCTMSSSRSARAARSRARPAPTRRSSAATRITSSCG